MTVRTIEDVIDDTFLHRGHEEYVGCGTIYCSIQRHRHTNSVRFMLKGRRISRQEAGKLVEDWQKWSALRRARHFRPESEETSS